MTLDALRSAFAPTRGYLNAATTGLPLRATVDAMTAAITAWQSGAPDLAAYDEAVATSRSAFARVVGVPAEDVAIGATTAELVGLVAASLPAGAEVVTATGDFTSVTYPFLARGDLVVREVPVPQLADAIGPGTAAVAFSLVQSKDGVVADLDAVTAAARAAGALSAVDLTQAAGWLPVDASLADVTVTSAYKWLCAPRGTAFLTAADEARERLRPVNACWYAAEDVWGSVYGHDMTLARGTRRFDTSPAWLCWVGAAPALEAFADELAGPDPAAIRRHDVALADELRAGLGLEPAGSAIVSLPDPSGDVAARLAAAGLRAAGRGGCARVGFHVWNDECDVEAVLAALRTGQQETAAEVNAVRAASPNSTNRTRSTGPSSCSSAQPRTASTATRATTRTSHP